MKITTSYFINSIEIPNISTSNVPNASRVGKNTKLNQFIEEYEVDYLSKCLGASLYATFESQFEVLEDAELQTIKQDAEQKWKDLYNGKTYTKDGLSLRYRGLVFTEGSIPKSPIAYYVYKHFLVNDMSHYGEVGLQIEKAKNAKVANYTPKRVLAHQAYYDLTVGNYNDPAKSAGYRSLYQFIEDMNKLNKDTYPNWMPYQFGNANMMGL